MLVVIVIIAILVGIGLGIYQQARNTAWKEKARDTARQIATAWNVYLMDNHAFPAALVGSQFPTTAANMSLLYSNTANHIYLEQSADQRKKGMKDKWGNYFQVQFQDATYSGTVPSPIDGSTINANVIVWSLGPHPSDKSSSYCVAWQ